jgi:hypothetical protein
MDGQRFRFKRRLLSPIALTAANQPPIQQLAGFRRSHAMSCGKDRGIPLPFCRVLGPKPAQLGRDCGVIVDDRHAL